MYALSSHKGVFHIKANYSSPQLTCWFHDDPFNHKVYVKEEVLEPGFFGQFPVASL